jgi:hypothetical protein
MNNYQPGLQLKDLIRQVEDQLPAGEHCQPYIVDYLRLTNRLTMLRKPDGKGTIAIFGESAISEVLDHLNRNQVIYNG